MKTKSDKRRFCAFILSHGRAHNVHTFKTLRAFGYTGDVIIVCDNEDETIDEYRKKFGVDNVIVFDKQKEYERVDTYYNRAPRGVILYARNACFEIARNLGYTHFVELDDDYTKFEFRWVADGRMKWVFARHLDLLFDAMLDLLEATKAKTISLAQGGDMIGGANGQIATHIIKRKAMNSFFCATDRPFDFVGAINEDVNMYTLAGIRGELVFQTMRASLNQLDTQTNDGGMTGTYVDFGTYVKSFYSVQSAPSCVKVSVISSGTETRHAHWRIHHNVKWDYCAAKVLRGSLKK